MLLRVRSERQVDKIAWCVTTILFSCFFLLMRYDFGKYIFLLLSFILVILSIIKHNGKLILRNNSMFVILLMNVILYAISSVWAEWYPSYALIYARTTLMIGIYMYCIYLYYGDSTNVEPLFDVVIAAAVIVSVSALLYWGVNYYIMLLMSGGRIQNDFLNVNSIGVLCAIGMILLFEKILKEKKYWMVILYAPLVLGWAGSLSKKAFAAVFLGFVFHYINNSKMNNLVKLLRNFLIVVFVLLIAIKVMQSFPMLKPIWERATQFISAMVEGNSLTESDKSRENMIRMGLEVFREHPIRGIGMGNSVRLNSSILGREVYLHNNYVDLLCNVGIVGLVLFYMYYLIPFKALFTDRKSYFSGVCFSLFIIVIIMDYGMVTVGDRETYFYILIFNLQNQIVNNRRKLVS